MVDPSLAEILIAVAQVAGASVDEVHPRHRNGLVGIAVALALDGFGYTSNEITEPFGFRTAKAAQSSGLRARRKAVAEGRSNPLLMRVHQALHRQAA